MENAMRKMSHCGKLVAPAPMRMPDIRKLSFLQRCMASFGTPPGMINLGYDPLCEPKMVLAQQERCRLDELHDAIFYNAPRMVHHADELFRARLSELYQQQLAGRSRLLDLCSSWCSHLPALRGDWEVVGHGMNKAELQANRALRSWFIQDLNEAPQMGQFDRGMFDAVLCANGWQYLTQPEVVAAELARVLVPGGVVVISFSSHCFEEKAIAGWLARDMQQRADLVRTTLVANGFVKAEILRLDSMAAVQPPTGGGSSSSSSSSNSSSSSMHSSISMQGDPCTVVVGHTQQCAAQTANNVREWLRAPAIEAAATGAALHCPPATSANIALADVVLQWHAAYRALAAEACEIGIPASAIPPLMQDCTARQVQDAHEHLQNMVASFLSAGL